MFASGVVSVLLLISVYSVEKTSANIDSNEISSGYLDVLPLLAQASGNLAKGLNNVASSFDEPSETGFDLIDNRHKLDRNSFNENLPSDYDMGPIVNRLGDNMNFALNDKTASRHSSPSNFYNRISSNMMDEIDSLKSPSYSLDTGDDPSFSYSEPN